MNPTNISPDPAPNLSLPAVDPQQAAPAQAASVAPAAPAPTPGTAPAAQPAATGQAQAAPADTDTMIADDADLIEKAWVEKAKQLVDQTKNDPYNQNKEINKFKAQYIKKRYNKDIQVDNT